MKKIAFAAALLAAAPLAMAATAHNWLATAVVVPGGHRLGNPAAPTKLMEFVSYTCPHCGHFFKEADGPIKIALVQPGKLSVEIHHVIRDPVDYAAVVLAECGDPKKFFGNHDMFFAQQDKWIAKIQATSKAQQQRWYAGTVPARMRAIASDAGFYDMMETRGYTHSQVDACINDGKKVDALLKQSQADNEKYGVDSTPSFVLNGKTLDAHSWDELQKVLAPAKST
ncbi:MAG TPA: thioredoxin domain-containing protein [Croceibacterium sp.]|nr:thioredoxin domain-containing protein [Croceibacterium sp.]